MNSLANLSNGNKPKSEATNTIGRINRLRETFQQVCPGDREKVIEILTAEIAETEDEYIKYWLIRFRSILGHVAEVGNEEN